MSERDDRGDEQINPIHQDQYRHAEAELGGADNVEKTTYTGNATGTEPGDGPGQNAAVTTRVGSGGSNIALWVTGVLALLAMLAYATGFFG